VAGTYLQVPTVAFWAPASPNPSSPGEIFTSEAVSSGWSSAAMLDGGLYFPAVYGRETPDTVFTALARMFSGGNTRLLFSSG
jgi:hypothetical protein